MTESSLHEPCRQLTLRPITTQAEKKAACVGVLFSSFAERELHDHAASRNYTDAHIYLTKQFFDSMGEEVLKNKRRGWVVYDSDGSGSETIIGAALTVETLSDGTTADFFHPELNAGVFAVRHTSHLSDTDRKEIAGNALNIEWLGVHPDFQNQGKGAKMLTALRSLAQDEGSSLMLETIGDDSFRFYRENDAIHAVSYDGTVESDDAAGECVQRTEVCLWPVDSFRPGSTVETSCDIPDCARCPKIDAARSEFLSVGSDDRD